MLKIRDVFDIAVVDCLFSELLRDNLRHVAHLKQGISERLSAISEELLRQELDELAIADEWRPLAATCLQRMKEIAEAIPERSASPDIADDAAPHRPAVCWLGWRWSGCSLA